MRIWLITSELPSEFAGGIARYVDNFARALGAAGHDVTIFARSSESAPPRLAPGVEIVPIRPGYDDLHRPGTSEHPDQHPSYPYNLMSYWPAFSFQVAQAVLQRLKTAPPPDVIECQEYGAVPYYLLQRKLTERGPLQRIPIVVHLHSPTYDLMKVNQAPRFRFPEYWIGQMEKFCVVAADALLCPSHYLTRTTRAAFSQPLDLETISLPFVADYQAPPSAGTPGALVYVGRMEWRKGVYPFIQTCEKLWNKGREFRLTLIGGDTHFDPRGTTLGAVIRSKFAKWIDAGRLRFAGQVRHTDVRAMVRDSWAAVIPSLWENFPNTCIEAMAAGTVALGSTDGGQAEMIDRDGENGFIFDWAQPGHAERQLERILDLSPAERAVIAERGQRRIESMCDPSVVLPKRIAHFQRVISEHRAKATFPSIHGLAPSVESPVSPREKAPHRAGDPAEAEVPGLLSVIVPFYNLGDYVEETLDNIRASTYRPIEVILVDDGSTDEKSIAKLRQLESRVQRDLTIVRTDNQGLASARNNGVKVARGEFIALVDADDKVDAGFFERAIDVLGRYANVGFVSSWVRYFEGSTGIWPTWNTELPYLLGHNMNCVLSVVRRRAFRAIGGADPEFAYNYEDYGGWMALTVAGWAGVSLCEPLVKYRVRAGSMLRSMNDAQFMHLHDLLTQRFPEAYRAFGQELFNLQNANGPGRLWNHPAIATPLGSTPVVATAMLETVPVATGQGVVIPSLVRTVEDELRWIESSRTWRMVQKFKRSAPYRALAELRYGPGWEQAGSGEPPEQRLQRIKSSRSFRLIQAAKRTWLYRVYAERKYGRSGG